jgi:D-alanyl-D-alanine carboxypeptidase/D-alanyl-D-alanine-endopeptidase (penicillin-binding protein 4)
MRRALVTLLAVAPAALASAREPAPSGLAKRIDAILDRPAFAPAFWAAEVRSLTTGKILYARNAAKNMTPASTMKLVTTAAILDALGPDARLSTTLESAGRLDARGRILGDVFLVGRGDPALALKGPDGLTAFDALADALRSAGIRSIEGRLVGDEALFRDRRGEDWEWSDLVWCYGAEVSALSWNDNCAELRVAPGEREGEPVSVERSPWSAYYDVVSSATTAAAGAKSDLTLVRELGANRIRLSGTQPLGAETELLAVALEDPARYAATVFAESLEARGIHVSGGVASSSDPPPPAVRVLASHDGPPLSELIKSINKPSQNLHAEMMLRLLGARVKGEGSLAAGLAAVREFLKRVGAPGESWSLIDGSGLSRTDLLTAHEIVSLLAAMDRHRYAAAFRDSLPVAGLDGTLASRMKGTPAAKRVFAKTGTLRQANALAGYLTTRQGERLAFSIVVNHLTAPGHDAVAAIDEVVALLAGS